MKRIYEKKRKKQKKEMKHLKHFELKTSGKGKSKLITLFFLIDNISHGAMRVCVCGCVSMWVCMHVCSGMGTGMVSECAKRKEWKGVEKNEKEK